MCCLARPKLPFPNLIQSHQRRFSATKRAVTATSSRVLSRVAKSIPARNSILPCVALQRTPGPTGTVSDIRPAPDRVVRHGFYLATTQTVRTGTRAGCPPSGQHCMGRSSSGPAPPSRCKSGRYHPFGHLQPLGPWDGLGVFEGISSSRITGEKRRISQRFCAPAEAKGRFTASSRLAQPPTLSSA